MYSNGSILDPSSPLSKFLQHVRVKILGLEVEPDMQGGFHARNTP